VWLLGQPPSPVARLRADTVVNAAAIDRAALIDEWRAANDYYQELEKSEGASPTGNPRELEPGLAGCAEVQAHPHTALFRHPADPFRMAELDKLIVCQRHVSTTRRSIKTARA